MADDEVHGEALEHVSEVRRVVKIDEKFDVPAERRNQSCQPPYYFDGHDVPLAIMIHHVQPDPAYAGAIQRTYLCLRDIRINDRDTAQAAVVSRERIEQCTVIGAINARLNQHRAVDMK